MDDKDIIAMAREAGFASGNGSPVYHKLNAFAALVAAVEREACAKVCEDAPEPDGKDLADKIRARGQV